VLASTVELSFLKSASKLFISNSLQDLAKWKGTPQKLKMPWMLANASEDIAMFERDKLKGTEAISLSQKNEADKHRMVLHVAAEKMFKEIFHYLPRSIVVKLPIIPLGLPPVQRGGKRYRQADPAASSDDPPPASPSRLPEKRSRMSRAQRIAADAAAAATASRPLRNTRSAATAQGPSPPQDTQPSALPEAPPQPARGERAPAMAPTSHHVPQDIAASMEAAAQRAGLSAASLHQSATSATGFSSPSRSSPAASQAPSVAMTEFYDAKIAALKDEKEMMKVLLEGKHKDMLVEKEKLAAAQQLRIESLQARLDASLLESADHKANAVKFKGMFELQSNDHQRMFAAMLEKLNK
jgi:hypothetical protein